MAYTITEDCTNCGACEPECPNSAIYESGITWKYSDGTSLKGLTQNLNGDQIDADIDNPHLSGEWYYIVEDKCTDCKGLNDEPNCASVCPMDAIQLTKEESNIDLDKKIDWLHRDKQNYLSFKPDYSIQEHHTCNHNQPPIVEDISILEWLIGLFK